MELTENTLSVLKNFSAINQNILIKQGNVIKTISEARNVLAIANVVEEFPKDVGIYDLNEFIGVLRLVDTPNLKFDDDYMTISDSSGRSKIKYFYSSEDTLTTPSKDITMPNVDVQFKLDVDVLNRLKQASATLGHNEVSIVGKDGCLNLSVVDSNNVTSNAFSIDIDGEFKKERNFSQIAA